MDKIKKYMIILLVIALLFVSLYVYEKQLNTKIMEKHYKIGLITDSDLALEINSLVSNNESINSEEKRRIESLLEILYRNGSLYSNYEITNDKYLDKFEMFSYLEDYSYNIDRMIRDGIIDDKEIKELEKYRNELENMKETLIDQSEILD